MISFNQSTYSVDEDSGSVKPVLLLNNPSLNDFTMRVLSINESASGKLITSMKLATYTKSAFLSI